MMKYLHHTYAEEGKNHRKFLIFFFVGFCSWLLLLSSCSYLVIIGDVVVAFRCHIFRCLYTDGDDFLITSLLCCIKIVYFGSNFFTFRSHFCSCSDIFIETCTLYRCRCMCAWCLVSRCSLSAMRMSSSISLGFLAIVFSCLCLSHSFLLWFFSPCYVLWCWLDRFF